MKRDVQREEREDSGWRGPRRGREKWGGTQGEREREGTSGNGSIESAAQRNAPPLALVWQLCGRTTASACVRKRERERRRGRGRDKEKEREREKGTDGKRKGDRRISANQYRRRGRRGREESQAESRWARSGLPEFHTHRVRLRVPSRRRVPHEGGGATPSLKGGPPRIPGSRAKWAPKVFQIFRKEKKKRKRESAHRVRQFREIGAEECDHSGKAGDSARRRTTLRERRREKDTPDR